MKNLILVIAIYNAISSFSYAESPDEPDFAVSNEELDEDTDENSRSMPSGNTFGPSAVPTGSRILPGIRPKRLNECYICTNCPTVLANTTYKACPYSADSLKNNKCVVYSEQYRHMKRPWYIRGCASERGTCADINKSHSSHESIVKLNSCYECTGDKCNVNGGDRPADTLAAFFVVVVTPLLTKHTLS